MDIRELIRKKVLFLDGAMGTMLQKKGLDTGEHPERFNYLKPDAVKEIHKAYLSAGSDIIYTNTFGANTLNYSPDENERVIREGVRIAREARDEISGGKDRFVGLSIGSTGRFLKPFGDLDFEDAVSIFSETVRCGVRYGADLIIIETMTDIFETKAALIAAKENSSLPVFVSNSYQASGKLMTGAPPAAVIAMLEGMGADAVGLNCSLGPGQLAPIVREYLKTASVPVLVKPNAGLPHKDGERTVYDISPREFADAVSDLALEGARLLGGCCGTSPEYIALLREAVSEKGRKEPERAAATLVSSHLCAVNIDDTDISDVPFLSGGSIDELVECAYELEDEAPIAGLDASRIRRDEPDFLRDAVFEIQSAVKTPLMITSNDPASLEAALRIYKGRPAVRPANTSEEYMNAVQMAVSKYGGVIV